MDEGGGLIVQFIFACGATRTDLSEVDSSTQASFTDCAQACANSACDAFTYDIKTGFCLLSDGYPGTAFVTNFEYDSGYINIIST